MTRLVALLGITFLSLTMVSCGGKKKPPPPPPVVVHAPDYKPIGEGIKVHSYALIGIAAIVTVGLIVRKGNH